MELNNNSFSDSDTEEENSQISSTSEIVDSIYFNTEISFFIERVVCIEIGNNNKIFLNYLPSWTIGEVKYFNPSF
jgi:hypothetical protein